MDKRTVMVIDDEKLFRKNYRRLLKSQGFRVVAAPNALEVSNLLMREKSNLDLIILDINLPEIDGRDISDLIDEYAPDINILVSSVHPLRDQKLKIPRATDYHSKLDGEDILLKKVCKLMGVEPKVPRKKPAQ